MSIAPAAAAAAAALIAKEQRIEALNSKGTAAALVEPEPEPEPETLSLKPRANINDLFDQYVDKPNDDHRDLIIRRLKDPQNEDERQRILN